MWHIPHINLDNHPSNWRWAFSIHTIEWKTGETTFYSHSVMNIANKVKNIGIKRNAEDFLIRLKPISVALDRVQSDTCVINETEQIWKDLEKTFEENDQPMSALKHVKDRYNQVMTDSHCLTNMLHPRNRDNDLWPDGQHIRYKTGPFHQYMFVSEIMNSVSPITWWHSQSEWGTERLLTLIDWESVFHIQTSSKSPRMETAVL